MSNESGIAAVRLSRLDSTGQPFADGVGTAWALCDPTSGEITFNYDTGDEIIKKDGLGNICFNRKRADQLKGASPKITVCGAGPEVIELTVNGPGQILGGATPTGFALRTVTCGAGIATERGGVFLEFWTGNYNCGAQDPTNPWIRHWAARWWANYEGGTWDSGAHDYVFSGESQPTIVNPTVLTANHGGPFQDITGLTLDQAYLYGEQYDDTLPECTGDYVDTAFED